MKKRTLGTVSRGIRAGIVRGGDDPVEVVVEALRESWENEGYRLRDRDVIGVTESLIARAQENYVSVDEIAEEAREIFGRRCAVVFPILSRNRFSLILKALARGLEEINLLLSYPADEVGNPLMDRERLAASGLNPAADLLTEEEYRRRFGQRFLHPFTGLDYLEFYREIVEGEGAHCSISLSNRAEHALTFCREVLAADIHSRFRTLEALRQAGGDPVLSLSDFCARPRGGGGFNPDYGLLGSNTATEEQLKLFPSERPQREALCNGDSGETAGTDREAGGSIDLRRRSVQGSNRRDLGTGRPGGGGRSHPGTAGNVEGGKDQVPDRRKISPDR